jgi:hypothetical protein
VVVALDGLEVFTVLQFVLQDVDDEALQLLVFTAAVGIGKVLLWSLFLLSFVVNTHLVSQFALSHCLRGILMANWA